MQFNATYMLMSRTKTWRVYFTNEHRRMQILLITMDHLLIKEPHEENGAPLGLFEEKDRDKCFSTNQ